MCNICSRDLPMTMPPGAVLQVLSQEEGETIVWSSRTAAALSLSMQTVRE